MPNRSSVGLSRFGLGCRTFRRPFVPLVEVNHALEILVDVLSQTTKERSKAHSTFVLETGKPLALRWSISRLFAICCPSLVCDCAGRHNLGNDGGAMATSTSWIGAAGADWFTDSNWTNQVPTLSAVAILDNGNAAVISQSGAICGQLWLGNATTGVGSLDVAGGSLTYYGISDSVYIGKSGSGTVSVTNGGQVSSAASYNYTYVGYNSGSTGSVTIDGANSAWTGPDAWFIGNFGSGSLAISNGGHLTSGSTGGGYSSSIGYSSGATGFVTVDGANSTWTDNAALYVGNRGSGTVTITNGGQVACGEGCHIGGLNDSQSTGIVNVVGDGSSFACNLLVVGDLGYGTLNVSDGAAGFKCRWCYCWQSKQLDRHSQRDW